MIATNSAGTTTGADQTFQAGPGLWTPFTRCPVDDPVMLAADGVNTIPVCLASNSTHGSITIGNTTTLTGNSNLQVGLVANNGTFEVVGAVGGSLIADPATVTAGGITVTATVRVRWHALGLRLDRRAQRRRADHHAADQDPPGEPARGSGGPGAELLHRLGSGPDRPAPGEHRPVERDGEWLGFNPDGTPNPNGPLFTIVVAGAVQGDNTFSVPGASGCGPNGDGSLDAAVNAIVGLPSPSGANHLVQDDASSSLALPNVPLTGQEFSDDWHIAFD